MLSQSTRVSDFETTYLGSSFTRLPNDASSCIDGQNAAQIW